MAFVWLMLGFTLGVLLVALLSAAGRASEEERIIEAMEKRYEREREVTHRL